MRVAAAGRVGGVRAGLGSTPARRRRVVVVEAADWLPSNAAIRIECVPRCRDQRTQHHAASKRLTVALKTIHGEWHGLLLTAAKKVLDGHVTHDL